MKIHALSDLHVEFASFVPPPVDADLVVLAGDIHVGTAALQWSRHTFPIRQIVFVPGNHESYGHDIDQLGREMRALARDLGIIYLDNDVAEFYEHGVRIIGSTFWTDFKFFGSSESEIAFAKKEAGIHLRDFGTIRHGHGYLTPEQTVTFHAAAEKFIAHELAKPFDGKNVVVSHHCPALVCVHPRYRDDIVSSAFASRCEPLVAQAHLWIHGHTHASVDTRIGDIPERGQIICNPRGYRNADLRGHSASLACTFENPAFDPGLVIEV